MLYFIYPSDVSTEFLLQIPKNISDKFGSNIISIIKIQPSDESYSKSLELIKDIPENSIVIFMGHGQPNKLWGAESDFFPKKPFINQNESKIFGGKYLFLLSCDSNEFLKGSFSYSKVINSIGFGSLPTGIEEVENSRRLKAQGVNEVITDRFRLILVELVSYSFCDMIEQNQSFDDLSNYFRLRLNKKISQVILDDSTNNDNRILADLLFQMKTEMIFI